MLAALPLAISFLALVQGVVMFSGMHMLEDVGGSSWIPNADAHSGVKFSVCSAVHKHCILSSFPSLSPNLNVQGMTLPG